MFWQLEDEIQDPSFGAAMVVSKSSLDLGTMVMTNKGHIEIDGEVGGMSFTSICEDA